MEKYLVEAYIDGASRGNPGHSGAGIFVKYQERELIKSSFYLGQKTNNQAEYLALALAIFLIKKNYKTEKIKINFISDSLLLVKQINKEYKIKNKNLLDLKNLIDKLLLNIDFKMEHVLREKNKMADKLANEGIDKKNGMPKDFIELLINNGITNI